MNNQVLFRILEGQNIEGKYYLKKLLGSGGFGGVYLADEVVKDRLIRELAVKLIITDNPDKQLDELIVSTTLKHPNLIDCYTCGECQLNNIEFLYLLMEKADYSLEDELKKDKLSEEKVKELVLDIVNGLDYLHSQNPVIVHRDLKPGNILRIGDKWKISDFGLVRSLKGTATQTTTIIGSMGYAPPEAYEGKISPAWDIWSLGIVIYESLTGKLPFDSDSLLQLMRQVAELEPDVNELSTQWQELVKSCLEKEGKQRSTAQLILQTLSSSEEQKQFIISNENENTISQKQTRLEPLLTSATETQATISEKNTINQKWKNNISSIPYFGNNPFRCIPPEPYIGHSIWVNSVAISADGKTIISGSADKTIKIWDLATGKLRHTLEGHSEKVQSVTISGDGRTVVSRSEDNTIKIWDLDTCRLRHTLNSHFLTNCSVVISGDGKTIVSGSSDKTIKIWDVETGKLRHTLYGHSGNVYSVVISEDGKTIVSGSWDNTIKIWDLTTAKLRHTLQARSDWVKSVAISKDGKTLVNGSGDKTIKILDLGTGKLRNTLESHSDDVNSVIISGDGKTIVSGSDDNTIKIWDLTTGKLRHTLDGHSDDVKSVAISEDGKTIVSGSSWGDTNIKIWDLATGKLRHTLNGHLGSVYSVVISRDGNTVVSGSADNTIKIWDLATGKLRHTLNGHSGSVYSVVISGDTKTIVSGSGDNTIKIWDLDTGELLRTFSGHSNCVYSVALSADGKTVVSSSYDQIIKIWDLHSGKLLHTIKMEGFLENGANWFWIANQVLFSPDDKQIIAGCSDGTIKIWDVEEILNL